MRLGDIGATRSAEPLVGKVAALAVSLIIVVVAIYVAISLPGKGGFVAAVGLAGLVLAGYVYSRWGGYGLLVAYAATTWYPFSLYYFLQLFGNYALTMGQLAVLAVGSAMLFLRMIGVIHGRASLVVPGLVLGVATVGWMLTWPLSAPSVTVNDFLVVVVSVLLVVICLVMVDTPRRAGILCWAATLSTLVTYGLIAVDAYIVSVPLVSGSTGSNPAGEGRLYGLLNLPGAPTVEAVAGRSTGIIAAAMVVPFVYMMGARTTRQRVLSGVVLLLVAAIEVSTIGRAGWVAIVIACLVVGVLGVAAGVWRFSRLPVLLGGMVVVGVAALFWVGRISAGEVLRVANILRPGDDVNMQHRLDFWRATFEQIKLHPLGIGFYAMLRRFGVYEHNTYLVLATGLGIVGLVAFIVLWAWVARRSLLTVRTASRDAQLVGLSSIGVLIVALVAGMADNTAFRSELFWLVWGAAAALSYRGLPAGQEAAEAASLASAAPPGGPLPAPPAPRGARPQGSAAR